MKLSKMLVALLSASALTLNTASFAFANGLPVKQQLPQSNPNAATATPIKHLVVIFQENVSFDHYFATYPKATNPQGEPKFFGANNTPSVNNLVSANLLTNNPNFTNTANGAGAANPFRLDRTPGSTADQNHSYTPGAAGRRQRHGRPVPEIYRPRHARRRRRVRHDGPGDGLL